MYQRSEYTYRRDDDHDRDREGGWRSWFGMGKKDDDRDYHYARTTTYRNDDRDYNRDYNVNRDYNRDRDYNYNNTTRTNTYVRDDDRDRGFGGRLGTDYRGGYGYQTSGEYNRGYGGYGTNYDRDNRGWSNTTTTYDRDRYDGNRYTTGGEATARGGYYSSSSNNWDRPTYGADNYTSRNYGGYGNNDRDNTRGYSYTSRTNW
ncbi:translation initiation factor IF-2-like [Paramacrobiotus metropolitanus]|uniref:translation initiation factor IF-2-like n=1 Tax=Paramacrobiotus metropolitanus TaxID=2943436 RepID=UPI002445AF93|nr:translation initiation factor IF-2-like [Paramacrobiotus metropolitanus]